MPRAAPAADPAPPARPPLIAAWSERRAPGRGPGPRPAGARACLLASILALAACGEARPEGSGGGPPARETAGGDAPSGAGPAAAGRDEPAPAPARRAGGTSAQPGLILLLLDTVRADRLDLYGYPRATAPFLSRLGETSYVFERAYSAASWTRASTASLFTARIPEAHGVEGRRGLLVPELTTLAEVLASHGYDTKGVISNPHVRTDFGFSQGFADYLWADPGPGSYRAAPGLRGLIGQVLARRTGAPLFLYLHYMDPHSPYHHHPETDFDPDYAGPMRSGTQAAVTQYMDRREELGGAHDDRIRDLYDGEIAWLDRHLEQLFDGLDAHGLLATSWVAITSDHGEGLWTHEERSHGRDVYEEQIRVPLILRPPGGLEAGRRIEAPISLIDVAPTLLELLGLPPEPSFDGRSWAAALREGAAPPVRPIVVDQELSAKPPGEPERIIELVAVVDGHDKLVLDRVTNELTLFDLSRDPHERAGERIVPGPDAPPRARELFGLLAEALGAARERRPPEPAIHPDMPPEMIEQMEALGYAGMGEDADGEGGGR